MCREQQGAPQKGLAVVTFPHVFEIADPGL
jgi:hypothetical protein